MNLERRAGATVVGMGVGRGHDCVSLTGGTGDVHATVAQGGGDDRLLTRGKRDYGIDDTSVRGAAVRIRDAAGRDDVDVDADRLSVITLVADLDD